MKFYLLCSLLLLFTVHSKAQQQEINFVQQNINFSAAPRTMLNPMSLKLWDNYVNGGPSTYGTVLEIYGKSGHQTSQLHFGGWDNSKIRYREAFYAENSWSNWMTLLDSKNDVESAGSLKIMGAGNHYISQGNVGIGTSTPTSKLELMINSSYGDELGALKIKSSSSNQFLYASYLDTFSAGSFQVIKPGVGPQHLLLNPQGGFVGIGTPTPQEQLSVNGKIRAKEIKVEIANWPDYVFTDNYPLPTLDSLETYIKTHKHLPEIPNAKEAEANGIALGEMNKLLLKKVEELTLLLIRENKERLEDRRMIEKLQNEIIKLR